MLSYIESQDGSECYGCRSCEQICPVGAVSMDLNSEGFLYPAIDNKCIGCTKCEKSCPFMVNIKFPSSLELPYVYAIKNKDKQVLLNSSSGGMFSALANHMLTGGGIVVGCAFDDHFNAVHEIAENESQLIKMRGSKYVQSDTKDTYSKTKKALENGRKVLYTGTPCQIAGLKAFLKKDYDNLITADLICHGVPSNALFKKYLEWLETDINGKVTDYKFRDKKANGWASAGSFTYKKLNKYRSCTTLPQTDYFYYSYYLRGDIYRESCYKCKYSSVQREGDFTIADYWNIQKFHPEFYPPDGVSLVMVNTKKAECLLSQISDSVYIVPSKIEYAKMGNGNLCHPSHRPATRDNIYKEIDELGFYKAAKKYCRLKKILPRLKKAIPYNLKCEIKKIIRKG